MTAITLQTASIVDRIVSQWRGAPSVTVVESTKELPARDVPPDVRGMYRDGQTWIVSGTQHHTQVSDTLAHEALGHHAMRETLGSRWRGFMHAVADGAAKGDWRLQSYRNYVHETYTDQHGNCNLSRVKVADEMAAALVEARFDGESGRLVIKNPGAKLLDAAAGHFAREALYLNRPASISELEGTLLVAEHVLRHGSTFWGLAFKIKRLYAAAMSKPMDRYKPPMSLHESQRRLDAEVGRIQSNARTAKNLMGVGFLLWVAFVWAIKLGLAFLVIRFLWRHLV